MKIKLNLSPNDISQKENKDQPSRMNLFEGSTIYQELLLLEKIKKRKSISYENQFSISINEYLISRFCPCFKNENLNVKEKVFDSIDKIIFGFPDIPRLINSSTEVKNKNLISS